MATERNPFGRHELFNPKVFWPFILASILVAFSASALYDFVKGSLGIGEFRWLYLVLLGGALIIVAMMAELIERQIGKSIVSPETRAAPQKKGIIALCSKDEVVRKALNHHHPTLEYAWLVASRETRGIGDKLKEELGARPTVEVCEIKNEADCREIAKVVRDILAKRPSGLSAQDIIVDFTGLTKPATAGAVLSALQMGAPLQYTGSLKIGGVQEPIVPEEIILNYDVVPKFIIEAKKGSGPDQAQVVS